MERLKMSTLSILVLSLVVVMGCAAAYPPAAFAGWKTIVGEAPMQGDEAAAEQQAINNALQKVVSSTAGAMIQSNTQIQNGQVVMNSIMANAAGYVRSYNVLSSGPSTDGTRYVVTMECDVLTDNIQQTIASMESNFQTHQNEMQNPRVLVLGIRPVRPGSALGHQALHHGRADRQAEAEPGALHRAAPHRHREL